MGVEAHNPDDVIRYFGGVRETQAAFGKKSRAIVYYWKQRGLMPELLARKADEMSRGLLKFDPKAYDKRPS